MAMWFAHQTICLHDPTSITAYQTTLLNPVKSPAIQLFYVNHRCPRPRNTNNHCCQLMMQFKSIKTPPATYHH